MNRDIIISVLVSVVISGLFSLFLFNYKEGANQAVNNYQRIVPGEILSVQGAIAEIKDSKYIIDTDEGVRITVDVNSATTYATSFPPTLAESEALFGTATSTHEGVPLAPKLKLNPGDRIEATSRESIVGKKEFIATAVKLIR